MLNTENKTSPAYGLKNTCARKSLKSSRKVFFAE